MKYADYQRQDAAENVKNAYADAQRLHKALNAVVTFVDVEAQLEHLRDVDENAPLYGIPIVLKDNVSTKGIRTTASSRILDNYVPVYDATIVKKLREAGAICIAKASMDELGMGGTNLNAYTGKVNNPYDLERISGGSSGGSAVLVAAGVVPMAIGTDTGDSVRKPAAYCGVVGVKPTYGRISRYGIIPYASSLDHVGYFNTNVNDAAKTLEVLAGRDDLDMTSSSAHIPAFSEQLNSDLHGKRIAVLGNVQDAIQDTRIKEQFTAMIKKLESRGAIVETVYLKKELMEALLPTYYIISNAEAVANHSNLDGIRFGIREAGDNLEEIMIHSRTKGFSSAVRKRFVIGSYSLFVENQEKLLKKAHRVRRVIVDAYRELFASHDAVLAVAAPTTAPYPNESVDEQLSASYLIAENHMLLGNFSGFPSMSVPSGLIDGLPIAINVSAKAFDEQTMFNVAKAIEEESGMVGNCVEVKA